MSLLHVGFGMGMGQVFGVYEDSTLSRPDPSERVNPLEPPNPYKK